MEHTQAPKLLGDILPEVLSNLGVPQAPINRPDLPRDPDQMEFYLGEKI